MLDFCGICGPSVSGIWKTVRCLLLLGGLFRAAWTDGRSRRLSNRLLLHLLYTGILSLTAESCMDGEWIRLWEAAEGLLYGGSLCFCCYLLSGGGVGAGDVKLFAVTGLYLGRTGVLRTAVLSSFLAAGGCVTLLLLGRVDRNMRIPCAPFVLLAVMLVLFGGWG